jgi:hypothetical protein
MADELDPILEGKLRDALRVEAASVPFTVTAADVRRRRAERSRRGRFVLPATLLAAAAAIAILVVAGGALRDQHNTVAASPTASVPASCQPVPASGEGRRLIVGEAAEPADAGGTLAWRTAGGKTTSGGPGTWDGFARDGIQVGSGSGIRFSAASQCFTSFGATIASVDEVRSAVAAGRQPQPSGTPVITFAPSAVFVAGLPFGEQVLRVEVTYATADGSEARDAWVIPMSVIPDRSASPSSGTADGLPSYADMERSIGQASPGEPILLRGQSGPVTGDPATISTELGEIPPVQLLDIDYACTGGTITVKSFVGGTEGESFTTGCSGTSERFTSSPESSEPYRLVVEASGTVAWRVVVAGWSTGTPSVDPSVMDIGRPGEALVVRTEGGAQKPSAIVLEGVEPSAGGAPLQPRQIARIPGSILGANQQLVEPLGAKVSVDGRLALAIDTGAETPSVLLVDVRTGTAKTLELDIEEIAFGPDGHLAWIDASGAAMVETAPDTVAQVYSDPAVVRSRGGTGSPVWLKRIGIGLLAASYDSSGAPLFSAIRPDGTADFGPTLPALWGSFGIERPYDATGHVLSRACDSSGSAAGGGCALVRTRGDGTPERWLDTRQTDAMAGSNAVFAADGASAWVLQVVPEAGGGKALDLWLGRTNGDGTVTDLLLVEKGVNASSEAPAIVGLRDGDTAVTPVAVVRDAVGTLFLVSPDGAAEITGDFVGWGGGTGTYPMN